jgi:Leucine-rich repeat (LRR) protein
MMFAGCGESGEDNNITNPEGILDYNNTVLSDEYDTTDDDGSEYVNPDLGELVDDDDIVTDGQVDLRDYDLEDFKSWYSTTCNGTFNPRLYNSVSGAYNGNIDCSNRNLYDIDLNYMSIFTSIKKIDLSHNHITYIDFSPLSNTEVIEVLDISYNDLDNGIDFSPLYNLKNINELWIQGNHIEYTREEREELYRGFNNRSFTIYF